jgi:uncharacterized membrane protein YeiB
MRKIFKIFCIIGIIILTIAIIYKIVINEYDLLFLYSIVGILCYVGSISLSDDKKQNNNKVRNDINE